MGNLKKYEDFESSPLNEGLEETLIKLNMLRKAWGRKISAATLSALDKVAKFIWNDDDISNAMDNLGRNFGAEAAGEFVHNSLSAKELMKQEEERMRIRRIKQIQRERREAKRDREFYRMRGEDFDESNSLEKFEDYENLDERRGDFNMYAGGVRNFNDPGLYHKLDNDDYVYGTEFKQAEDILKLQGYNESQIKKLGRKTMKGLNKLARWLISDNILPFALQDAFKDLTLSMIGEYLGAMGPEDAPSFDTMKKRVALRDKRFKARKAQLKREANRRKREAEKARKADAKKRGR